MFTDLITGNSAQATFLQYAIWFLAVYQSIKRLIEELYDGTLAIVHSAGITRSRALSPDDLFQYGEYYEKLRTHVLGFLGPTDNIIYQFGEPLDQGKEPYWCEDMQTFAQRFMSVPTFRFRTVYDGIRGEARFGTASFESNAVRLDAFGLDQDVCNNLALSFQVRYLLGQIGAKLMQQELQQEKQRVSAMTPTERLDYTQTKREQADRIARRFAESRQRREGHKHKYGPDELLLVSDEQLLEDLRKYGWNWERFIRDTSAG